MGNIFQSIGPFLMITCLNKSEEEIFSNKMKIHNFILNFTPLCIYLEGCVMLHSNVALKANSVSWLIKSIDLSINIICEYGFTRK